MPQRAMFTTWSAIRDDVNLYREQYQIEVDFSVPFTLNFNVRLEGSLRLFSYIVLWVTTVSAIATNILQRQDRCPKDQTPLGPSSRGLKNVSQKSQWIGSPPHGTHVRFNTYNVPNFYPSYEEELRYLAIYLSIRPRVA